MLFCKGGLVTLEEMLVVMFLLIAVDVVGIVVFIIPGMLFETTVPLGYTQPHNTKPLGQLPILWHVVPAGQLTCAQLTQEVRLLANR